jgi:hypothetical protein
MRGRNRPAPSCRCLRGPRSRRPAVVGCAPVRHGARGRQVRSRSQQGSESGPVVPPLRPFELRSANLHHGRRRSAARVSVPVSGMRSESATARSNQAHQRQSGAVDEVMQLDATRTGGDAGQDRLWAGDRILRSMVLAEDDRIDVEIVGEDGLVDDLPDRGGLRKGRARIIHRHVPEGIKTHHEVPAGGLSYPRVPLAMPSGSIRRNRSPSWSSMTTSVSGIARQLRQTPSTRSSSLSTLSATVRS